MQWPTKPRAKRPTHEAFVITGEGESAFWTKIGAAWPHDDGKGFNVELILARPRQSTGPPGFLPLIPKTALDRLLLRLGSYSRCGAISHCGQGAPEYFPELRDAGCSSHLSFAFTCAALSLLRSGPCSIFC
jgi:hypothetical protein